MFGRNPERHEPPLTPEEEIKRRFDASAQENGAKDGSWLPAAHDALVKRYLKNPELIKSRSLTILEKLAKEDAWETIQKRKQAAERARAERRQTLAEIEDDIEQLLTTKAGLKFLARTTATLGLTASLALETGLAVEKGSELAPENHLEGLVKEATPERMDRLLTETLPRGWRGNIREISYEDEPGPFMSSYGLPETREAADTDTGIIRSSAIVFYQSARGDSARGLLLETLTHEICHANDWNRDWNTSPEDKERLHQGVLARVQAPDRYMSAYVESINRPDKQDELELKATEYWAEIGRVYFNAADPAQELSDADRHLVEQYIRATDGDFNQHRAWQVRQEIIGEIEDAQFPDRVTEFLGGTSLPAAERQELGAWVNNRWLISRGSVDQTAQAESRWQLRQLAGDEATDEISRRYFTFLLQDYGVRDDLAANLAANRTEAATSDLAQLKGLRDGETSVRAQLPPEKVQAIATAVAAQFEGQNLLTGNLVPVQLAPGELPRLLDWSADTPDWFVASVGWRYAPEDDAMAQEIIDGYRETLESTPPGK